MKQSDNLVEKDLEIQRLTDSRGIEKIGNMNAELDYLLQNVANLKSEQMTALKGIKMFIDNIDLSSVKFKE